MRSATARDAEPEERAAIFLELAGIEDEDLGRTQRAAAWIKAAMEEAPRDVAVLTTAAKLLEQIGDSTGLVQALTGAFEAASIRGEPAAEDAARIARLYAHQLHDPENGSNWFARAIDLDPDDLNLLREGREAFLQAGRNREADRLFLTEIDAVSDPEEISALHRSRAAFLSKDLGDEGEALRSLREAALQLPGDFNILSQMETLARRSGRWEDLAGILLDMAKHSGAEEEKADLFGQAGDLLWERVADFPRARRAYVEALKRKPDLPKALERIGRDT